MTHMRVRVVVRIRCVGIHPGHEAVVHIRHGLLRGVRFPLDRIVEMRHGRQRTGDGGGHVVGIALAGGYRVVVRLRRVVGSKHRHLVRWGVRRVWHKRRRVGSLPVVVAMTAEYDLVFVAHRRGELGSLYRLLSGGGLLRLGRARLLSRPGVGWRLLVTSGGGGRVVRGSRAPLEVFQTPLQLLAYKDC